MKKILVCLLPVFLCLNAEAQTARNLLSRFSEEEVAIALLPRDQWKPFPQKVEEWKGRVPDSVIGKIIDRAEGYKDISFAPIPATVMLEFKRTGNRSHYEDISFRKREQLLTLVLAESMEKKSRFTDKIVDGIWSLCEESFWGVPAHYYLQKAGIGLADVQDPSVDLFVSETSVLLAITDYLLADQLDSVSPLLRTRIYDEVNRRLLTPLEKDITRYNYLGKGTKEAPVNNWNPWVVSNWMTSLLLLENNKQRRVHELHRAMGILDNYINWMGDDGAIDEGPSYWFGAVGRLFDALEVMESASGGQLTIYDDPFIQNAGSYIYKFHIAGNYFISIADASPTINADGLLLYRIGKSVRDTALMNFGSWAFKNIDPETDFAKEFAKPRTIWNLLTYKECAARKSEPPVLADVWLKSIQLMAARTKNGFFVASHGGHNAESHNHNDVGDFLIYADGEPLIIDVGFGTYTAKTFSNERYTIWYNRSAYHNLPVINGFEQHAGGQYEARDVGYRSTQDIAQLDMDIALAWPEETGIRQWKRSIIAEKGKDRIIVKDAYSLKSAPSQLTQTFMTVCPTDITQPGKIIFEMPASKKVVMEYDASSWEVKKELMSADQPDEKRVNDNWGQRRIYRLLLVNKNNRQNAVYRYVFRKL